MAPSLQRKHSATRNAQMHRQTSRAKISGSNLKSGQNDMASYLARHHSRTTCNIYWKLRFVRWPFARRLALLEMTAPTSRASFFRGHAKNKLWPTKSIGEGTEGQLSSRFSAGLQIQQPSSSLEYPEMFFRIPRLVNAPPPISCIYRTDA